MISGEKESIGILIGPTVLNSFIIIKSLSSFVLMAWIAAQLGCGVETPIKELRGQVVEVNVSTLTDLKSLVIKDSHGELWQFHVEGHQGVTASHLRDHMVLAQPVTVRFRKIGELKYVDEITD